VGWLQASKGFSCCSRHSFRWCRLRTAWTKLFDAAPVAVRSHSSFVSIFPVSIVFSFVCFRLSFFPSIHLFFCTSLFSVLVRISCFVSVFFILLCLCLHISFIISHCSVTLSEVCQLSSPQCSHQSWVSCIGLTILCFILRLRWGRFLSYRSWGVKTWTESKMLEIAPFPLSKIHTRSGLPLKKHIGPSHSEPRTKFTTRGLEVTQLYERHPGEQHSQIKCKVLLH